MTYRFQAQPMLNRPCPVELINGRMAQRGYPWMNFDSWPKGLANEVVSQALEDLGYCIDAPHSMPAGACFGVSMSPGWEYAAACQMEVKRP